MKHKLTVPVVAWHGDMNASVRLLGLFVMLFASNAKAQLNGPVLLDSMSTRVLRIPAMTDGEPAAGKRVALTSPEYAGTKVFSTLYLPTNWKVDGPKLPIIFEYTGNYFPQSGSTGEVEDAGLGFGLSGGRYIWVSLPYINEAHDDNQVTWWGDTIATIDYAKLNVPRIIQQYNADPNAVFLCGFSRGAIGVNFLGLHDDEVAKLWDGFITHDHFDGVRQWAKPWGAPLEKYRAEAAVRLKRIGDRPYLVSQNGKGDSTADYIRSVLPDARNFLISKVSTVEALGQFPNEFAKASHNDAWLCKPSKYRTRTWNWMNQVVQRRHSAVDLGQLVFADEFDRTESQETTDEPGNGWTTSSEKTAAGNKQVDLRDGTLHIYTHANANHATSVRHTYEFRDGTIALRFKLHAKDDSLKMNFTDLGCKTVHAGHLFNVIATHDHIALQDLKTGKMNLEVREARSSGTLTPEQKTMLQSKEKAFPADLAIGQWHDLYAHVDGKRLSVELNGMRVAEFSSDGFAHSSKTMIRLLVPKTATVDDIRIWKRDPISAGEQ